MNFLAGLGIGIIVVSMHVFHGNMLISYGNRLVGPELRAKKYILKEIFAFQPKKERKMCGNCNIVTECCCVVLCCDSAVIS